MKFTPEQKAQRALFIGASEIPILAQCSPYATTEHDLWIEERRAKRHTTMRRTPKSTRDGSSARTHRATNACETPQA